MGMSGLIYKKKCYNKLLLNFTYIILFKKITMKNTIYNSSYELSFLFITKDDNMNRGSYRIWIKYLSESLLKIGYKVSIVNIDKVANTNFDVVIFDKGINLEKIKKYINNRSLFGLINPPASTNYPIDFIIVGSREEEASLSHYQNVFFVPLIELNLENLKFNNHYNSELIKVCYHGNSLHLSSFKTSGLKSALELYSKKLILNGKKLVLNVITEKLIPKWIVGKPNVEIKFFKYNWETFSSLIVQQDIGIIPNSYYSKPGKSSNILKKIFNLEYDSSDFILRMKNKSNFGRLLVFMQAGVPTICDITPSHLSLSIDSRNGYIASNSTGWLNALVKLTDFNKRNEISTYAKDYVNNNFNSEKYARHFADELKAIIFKKN
jgi:hypothetical protein